MRLERHPSVLHALLDSAEARPDGLAVRVAEQDAAHELGHAELLAWLRRGAAGLRALGVAPGERVVLALPTSREFLGLYLGALWSGVIPLAEPAQRPGREGGHALTRLRAVADAVGARRILVPRAAQLALAGADARLAAAEEAFTHGEDERGLAAAADGIAHLQLTSGTTGRQKIAVVRHRNIMANVAGIGALIQVRPGDALAFWLPMFHDMGLIAVSCALVWQAPMTITDAANFVRHPLRYWLQLISRYRASITAAPNSAYEACARLAGLRSSLGLDLSCCRAAFWGSEAVQPETIEHFERAFAPYGYRPEATLPVYGLAEATLAASVPDVEARPRVDRLDELALRAGTGGAAAGSTGGRRLDFVCVGRPLPQHELRVVDASGQPLAEGCVGEILLRGPSVVDGYWDDPAATRALRRGGFLATGDLGYLRDGELYVVGRRKELIIVRGQNYLPADIESFVERVLGDAVPKGVAVVGAADAATRTERLHLLVESRVLPVPDRTARDQSLRDALAEAFGLTGVTVHWLRKGGIPRTTSGKIQRFRCLDLVAAAHAGEPRAGAAPAGGPA